MLTYILFFIGFILVVKGADFLVDGASSLAKKFNVSDLVIGLTIVAFGTSLPEMSVNIFASLRGTSDIAIGNIIGSNIFNILVILGISALIYPLTVQKGTVWKEIPFSMMAVLVLGVVANDALIDGSKQSILTRIDGIVFIFFFIIFLYYISQVMKAGRPKKEKFKDPGLIKPMSFILIGLVGLILGGKWVINGAIDISAALGVSQSLIGLTIVAAGTSFPELATSAVAAFKKNSEIAVGNIVGSNIFNIFLILGISSIIKPLPFSIGTNIDILMVIFATSLLFIWMFIGEKNVLQRWQGGTLVLSYVIYLIFLIMRG